jgi:hypothetical protein
MLRVEGANMTKMAVGTSSGNGLVRSRPFGCALKITKCDRIDMTRHIHHQECSVRIRAIWLKVLVSLVVLSPLGCGGDKQDHGAYYKGHPDSTTFAGAPLSTEDYSINKVHLGMDSDQVRGILGEPDTAYYHTVQANRENLEVSWSYRECRIVFGNSPVVEAAALVGPRFCTSRGLRVGDSRERVESLYGSAHEGRDNSPQWVFLETPSGSLRGISVMFEADTVNAIFLGKFY